MGMPGHAHDNNICSAALPIRKTNNPGSGHYGFCSKIHLTGRENEARGRAPKASAELIDFFPFMGLALSLRKGTFSS